MALLLIGLCSGKLSSSIPSHYQGCTHLRKIWVLWGLNKNDPQRFSLNAWSSVGGTVWEGLIGVALKSVSLVGGSFEVLKDSHHSQSALSLLLVVEDVSELSTVSAPMHLFCHYSLELSETINPNTYFYKWPWSWGLITAKETLTNRAPY